MSSNVLPDRGPIDEIWAKKTEHDAGVWVSDEPTVEGVGERYLRATEARLHADKLAEALRECVNWLSYFSDTVNEFGEDAASILGEVPTDDEHRRTGMSAIEVLDPLLSRASAALAAAEGGQ